MIQIQQSPDFIIAGKAFAYRNYNEQMAEAFGYDWESLELNRDKSMSDAQYRRLLALRTEKVLMYGGSGIALLILLTLITASYPDDVRQAPLFVRVCFIGLTAGLITHSIVSWRRYTPELDYDLMARAITIPQLDVKGTKNGVIYSIFFGKQSWRLDYHQYKIINTFLKTPDIPAGQYFVAYYTPRTKHLLAIEPITLVSDFSKKEDRDKPSDTVEEELSFRIFAYLKALRVYWFGR